MTQNFDEAKDLQEDLQEEDYYVQPSRAEFIFEDGMDEPEPLEEGQEPQAQPAEATQEVDNDLAAALQAQTKPEDAPPMEGVDFDKFNEDFKKYAGVDFKEAMEAFQAVKQQQHQQVIQQKNQELAKDWGVEGDAFNERFSMVVERWSKLPDNLKEQYDNNEGAKLIWAVIEKEQQTQQQKQVPSLQRNSTKVPAGSQPKYLYTEAQISKMSNEEYAKNAGRITAAYAAGQVKLR